MPDIVSLQYVFGNLSGSIPLSYIDADLTALTNALNGLGNGSPSLQIVVIGTANVGPAAISNLTIKNLLGVSYGGTGANLAVITDGQVLIGSNISGGISLASIKANGTATILPGPGTLTLSRASNVSSLLAVKTFTALGTSTFTANVASTFKFTIVGGGGPGGPAARFNKAGAGGGAGATAIYWAALSSGANVTITVGAGGNATVGFGGNSSAAFSNGVAIVAQGGLKGDTAVGNVTVNGGSGGVAIGGAINITGGGGFAAYAGNVYPSLSSISGSGGESVLGTGAQGVFCPANSSITSVAGNDGSLYGGGGSGGANNNNATNATGGAGGQGIVMIEWTF